MNASLLATVLVAVATPVAALSLLTEENPPFNYTEKAKLEGSATDVVRDMASRARVAVVEAEARTRTVYPNPSASYSKPGASATGFVGCPRKI